MYKKRFLILFLIYFTLLCSPAQALDELTVYRAVQAQVISLKDQRRFKDALAALNSFEKSFPYSKMINKVSFEKGCILIDDLQSLEEGFLYLEKAQISQDKYLRKKIFIKKDMHAEQITHLRLSKVIYFLESFFIEKLSFPVNLAVLVKRYKGLNASSIIDGYGCTFEYQAIENEMFQEQNLLNYILFSRGLDKISNTSDDLKGIPENENDKNIQVIAIYKENNEWKAEISFFDKKSKRVKELTIDERSGIDNIKVFAIREGGVIFLRDDNSPLVIRK